ncbi:MAG: cytochrome c maturation protein CcmE [Candidatus Eisenbacteria bacterium]|nr:cytochrome c maturation protein CcmE [Candidatus Eisenbacteria bacterium]
MTTRKLVLGGAVIGLAMAGALFSFQKSLTPYVSFAEARVAHRVVQVKGAPDHAGARLDPEQKAFRFTMTEASGASMDVIFRGPKPGNFEQAESVVAIGRFESGVLEADQILVKCPSKYESTYPGAAEPPTSVPIPERMRLPSKADSAAGT